MKCKNNTILTKNEHTGIHYSKYWMPIHYDTIEDGQNKKSHLFFSKCIGANWIAVFIRNRVIPRHVCCFKPIAQSREKQLDKEHACLNIINQLRSRLI